MKVKLLRDTKVFFNTGQELEVEGREAERLIAFGLAEPVKQAKKMATKKKEG